MNRPFAPRPFVKWAGGKRALAKKIAALFPPTDHRYFEPFVGGGAVFFELASPTAVLSDKNPHLMNAYRAVQDDAGAVISILEGYKNDRDFYLEVRKKQFRVGSIYDRAADFIFSLNFGYNGLYRENKKGGYNVPFGANPRRAVCDAGVLRAAERHLQGVELRDGDFEDVVAEAHPGDVVYFDPPFVPLSATSKFENYTASGFGPLEHVRLRDVAVGLKQRGVHVVLSNSSAPSVFDLYGNHFNIEPVDVRRSINSKADRRGAIKEVLIH